MLHIAYKQRLPARVRPYLDELAISTVEIYQKLVTSLLPTTSTPHYLFNLRDLFNVMEGIATANLPDGENASYRY